jgi:hypothetical protein
MDSLELYHYCNIEHPLHPHFSLACLGLRQHFLPHSSNKITYIYMLDLDH